MGILIGPNGVPAQEAAKELPQPVELGGEELFTSDGVQLKATFFPGTEGKETVPLILLHSWKGDRREYAGFAQYLQRQGYAVLVPDLRGHGDSTVISVGGRVAELDGATMPTKQFEQMVYKDMEKLKGFLVKKNDAGELNLSKLCIIGADMGATVALYYADYDWLLNRYERASRRKAPAADVKAVVLISPKWAFKGLPLSAPAGRPAVQRFISLLIIVGRGDSKAVADAKKLQKVIERARPDPARPQDRDLFYIDPDTRLQGTRMFGVRGLALEKLIARFLELRARNQDFAWRQRQ